MLAYCSVISLDGRYIFNYHLIGQLLCDIVDYGMEAVKEGNGPFV